MWKKKAYRKMGMFMLLLILLMGLSATAMAANLPCRTAKATGSYKDPVTGEIEDAGGQDNEALGQSMVENVVDGTAMIEENPAGGYYVTLRFHLMDNLSDARFSVRSADAGDWENVESKKTASEGEQADFRLPVETEDSVIRAACHVEAMGRDVTFYVSLSDFTEGNQGGFVQTDSQDTETAAKNNPDGSSEKVKGLTTGGSSSASLVTGAGEAETVKPQQLNLSAGVWWMLFVIVFCANILASLAVMGVKTLLRRLTAQKKGEWKETDEADGNEPEFPELSEADWEELKDEEED